MRWLLVNYLFRLVSIGGFAANRAEAGVSKAMSMLSEGKADEDVLTCLTDPEISNELFSKRIKSTKFEDNRIARYLLSKIHDSESTSAVRLTTEAHLEHVLPIETSLWTSFDPNGKDIEEWIYSIGNMTLLEETLNKRLKNKSFADKVQLYAEKTAREGHTAIKMTFAIHIAYTNGRTTWDHSWIMERAEQFAQKSTAVWPVMHVASPNAHAVSISPPSLAAGDQAVQI